LICRSTLFEHTKVLSLASHHAYQVREMRTLSQNSTSVGLTAAEQAAVDEMTTRTLSNPAVQPPTGAELGAGVGAGAVLRRPREP
jgi:hypothetical protein